MVKLLFPILTPLGLPGGTVVKNLPASVGDAGDTGSIPGSERSPGEGNGNLLQYSCLENSMDRGAWRVSIVHGVPHGAPPGSSVHGILQARILEWVAIPPSRGSSRPRDRTRVSCVSSTAGRVFTAEPPGKPRVTPVTCSEQCSAPPRLAGLWPLGRG